MVTHSLFIDVTVESIYRNAYKIQNLVEQVKDKNIRNNLLILLEDIKNDCREIFSRQLHSQTCKEDEGYCDNYCEKTIEHKINEDIDISRDYLKRFGINYR